MSKADEFAWMLIAIGLLGVVGTFAGRTLWLWRAARKGGQAFNVRAGFKDSLRTSVLDNLLFTGGGVFLLNMPGNGASIINHLGYFLGFVALMVTLMYVVDALLGGQKWQQGKGTKAGVSPTDKAP
jgi:hypothetical protein